MYRLILFPFALHVYWMLNVWSEMDPTWCSPILSPTYGLKLETRLLDTLTYAVYNSDASCIIKYATVCNLLCVCVCHSSNEEKAQSHRAQHDDTSRTSHPFPADNHMPHRSVVSFPWGRPQCTVCSVQLPPPRRLYRNWFQISSTPCWWKYHNVTENGGLLGGESTANSTHHKITEIVYGPTNKIILVRHLIQN
jgi:hypothetical protein